MKFRVAIFSLLVCLGISAQASHIVGGNLGYVFLGNGPNGFLRYKLVLTTYTDCSPTSEIPQPEPFVSVGVYLQDAAHPTADKILKQAYTVPLVFTELITPPLPPGCSIGLGTCINKGIYELEVLLEPTAGGYHLYYERCCRNTALVNIINPSQTSTGFYAFIPPSSIPNSSPVFLDDPVPLICVNDTLQLLNTAVDPDGDFLLYSFTTPFAGFADIFNPAPPPEPILQWPITPVIFQNNFSANQPFGPGGYAYINALTGASAYKTQLIGNFAVAVQISEYRNNVLIATSRRDMQLIGLVCPQNVAPIGNFSLGLNVQAVEGDTLCFHFAYQDPNGDSTFLEVAGEPFLYNPPASFSQNYTGPSTVEGDICWAPPCGSARALPYYISYTAHDNGCIPRQRVNIMKVTVVPDTAQMHITGSTLVCGLQSATYTTSKTSGTFQWTITGGSLAQPTSGPSATVNWNLAPGQLGTVWVTRDGPCKNDTATLEVIVAPPQFAHQMPDVWLCPGSSKMLEAEPNGSNYVWTPSNWLSDTTIYNPVTNTPDSLMYSVTYRDSVGCEKYDSVFVIVNNHVPIDAGNDFSVCGNIPITLGGNPTGPANASFHWTPGIHLVNDTVANPSMPVPYDGWYYVEVFVDTCHAIDSLQITVLALPAVDAGPDTSACLGIPIQLHGAGNGTATWQGNGVTLDNTQILSPFASGMAGVYSPVLTITSSEGCSASDTVTIELFSLPHITILGGGASLCRGDTALLTASGAQDYHWSSIAYISPVNAPSAHAYTDSVAWVYVTGIDTNGCAASDSTQIEVFRAYFSSSSSDTILCLGDSVSLSFASPYSTNTYWMPTDFLSPNTGQTVVSKPLHDITYRAFASNASGCVDSADITLLVKPLPMISGSVSYQTKLFCHEVEVSLLSDNSSDSLYWLLGGQNVGVGSEAIAHLNPDNPQPVSLVGVSSYGCVDTVAVIPSFGTLQELLPSELPNIITPNGDAINDVWNPSLPDGFAECMRLLIFNRWGDEVFDSDTYPLIWQGKTKAGFPLTDGVYFYILEIGGIYKKGTITIAR